MPKYVTPDADGIVAACPECDAAGNICERTASNRQGTETYRCYRCDARFEAYVEREQQASPENANAYDREGFPSGLNESTKAKLRELREAESV